MEQYIYVSEECCLSTEMNEIDEFIQANINRALNGVKADKYFGNIIFIGDLQRINVKENLEKYKSNQSQYKTEIESIYRGFILLNKPPPSLKMVILDTNIETRTLKKGSLILFPSSWSFPYKIHCDEDCELFEFLIYKNVV